MTITVTYRSIDGVRKTGNFKTLAGASKFAAHWVGKDADIGCGYAVSFDGIGKVTVTGVSLKELFGIETTPDLHGDALDEQAAYEAEAARDRLSHAAMVEPEPKPYRITGCRCCDEQLYRVGCDCGAETMNLPF